MINSENNRSKYEKALEYEIFKKEEYGFAKGEILNAKCVFDIGGHIGLFSKRCRNINSNTEIHYFEPVGEFYNKAKATLGNDKNIKLNNLGISSKNERGTIFLNTEKTMQSSKYLSFLNPKGEKIESEFITLGEYIIQNNIDKTDVLKMDIEGMEFEVLASRGDLERGKINSLIAEIHIFNDKMENQRNQIFPRIINIFGNVEVINSGYRKEIFLIRAHKETGL